MRIASALLALPGLALALWANAHSHLPFNERGRFFDETSGAVYDHATVEVLAFAAAVLLTTAAVLLVASLRPRRRPHPSRA